MSLQWFRTYSRMVDDDKVRLLAFEDRWHFVALLCCKCQGLLDEPGPLMRRKVAVKLGLDQRELDEVVRRISEVGLISARTLQPTAWDKLQFVSDLDPTRNERQRRFRDKVKRTDNALHNAPVTRTEADTEADTEAESEFVEAPVPVAAQKRGTRLPADWRLPPDLRAWAKANRPDVDPDIEADKFRDYWHAKAGSGGAKLDWPATWRNWIRSAGASKTAPTFDRCVI